MIIYSLDDSCLISQLLQYAKVLNEWVSECMHVWVPVSKQ